MSKADEPAFPTMSNGYIQGGLSKKELFAAMAMQGFASDMQFRSIFKNEVKDNGLLHECIAGLAVDYADALIVELEKKNE